MNPEVSKKAYTVFHCDTVEIPPMTLRAGDAVDSYDLTPHYDE